ncbi:MAG: cytochrome C, partial [Alphaproteobacteria bacterium]
MSESMPVTCLRQAAGAAVVALAFLLSLAACDRGPKSGHGFTLPEGDAAKGEAAFVRFECTDCHSIAGREDLRQGVEPIMTVPLGGETPRIQTYGKLVTAIINPSHKISQKYLDTPVAENGVSKMRNYNDVMTVSELID